MILEGKLQGFLNVVLDTSCFGYASSANERSSGVSAKSGYSVQ